MEATALEELVHIVEVKYKDSETLTSLCGFSFKPRDPDKLAGRERCIYCDAILDSLEEPTPTVIDVNLQIVERSDGSTTVYLADSEGDTVELSQADLRQIAQKLIALSDELS